MAATPCAIWLCNGAMRLFYVLYPAAQPLRSILDAIRYLANPYEKECTHLTVRGPCSRHYQEKTLARLNQRICNSTIEIYDANAFWGERQNTIYLACRADDLKKVWHKPDYDYHPHITLYDGGSRALAELLLQIVKPLPQTLQFQAGNLCALQTFKGQTNLMLQASVDFAALSQLADQPLRPETTAALPESVRLNLIARLWANLGKAAQTHSVNR